MLLQNIKKENVMLKMPVQIPKGPINTDGSIQYEVVKNKVIEDLQTLYQFKENEMLVGDMRFQPGLIYTESENFGVKFSAAQKSLDNNYSKNQELNIIFMGTGTELRFDGSHASVYEGGDVLCHLGLRKAQQQQPTLLLRGVATTDFDPELNDKNKFLNLSKEEYLFGAGVSKRLTIAAEQFFIPVVLKMTNKYLKNNINNSELCNLTFNILGHSRGAITAYAMADLIDVWMQKIRQMQDLNTLNNLAANIAKDFLSASQYKNAEGEILSEKGLTQDQIVKALQAICNKKVQFKTKLMLYDPVEGVISMGDKFSTQYTLSLFGETIQCDYSHMPASVAAAQIFIAYDERRIAFQPTIPVAQDPSTTIVNIIPVLGVHATQKGGFIKFNDPTLDGYVAEKKSVFAKEALRALVDFVKIKSAKFLFDTLPVLDTVTLYNIFYANQGKGYAITKEHFIEYLAKFYSPNRDPDAYSSYEKFIPFCQAIMKKDTDFNGKIYMEIEKDIHDIYFNPQEMEHQQMLSALRKEMRNDKMYLGPIPFSNQDSHELRQIWTRSKKGEQQRVLTETYAYLAYDPTRYIWYPHSQQAENAHEYIASPYYVNISQILKTKIPVDLYYLFAQMNEKSYLCSINKNTTLRVEYQDAYKALFKYVNESKISHDVKVAIAAIVWMKEKYQYNLSAQSNKTEINNDAILWALHYQADMAIQLAKDSNFNQNPKLFKEIAMLLQTFMQYEKLHDQSLIDKKLIMENAISEMGLFIFTEYVKAELVSWGEMLTNYKQQEESYLSNAGSFLLHYHYLQTRNELKETTTAYVAPEHGQYHDKNREINNLVTPFVNKIQELQKELSDASDMSRLIEIERKMQEIIKEGMQLTTYSVDSFPDHFMGKIVNIFERDYRKDLGDAFVKNDRARKKIALEKTSSWLVMEPEVSSTDLPALLWQSTHKGKAFEMVQHINTCKTLWRGSWFEFTSTFSDDNGNTILHLIATMKHDTLWDVVEKSGYSTTLRTYHPHHIFNFLQKNNADEMPLNIAVRMGNYWLVEKLKVINQNMTLKMCEDHIFEDLIMEAKRIRYFMPAKLLSEQKPTIMQNLIDEFNNMHIDKEKAKSSL